MACEKCWSDAFLRTLANPNKTQADHYRDLLEERKLNPCTPEQQRGEDMGTSVDSGRSFRKYVGE